MMAKEPFASSALTSPLSIGPLVLSHRIVHAPVTRIRASDTHAPIYPIVKDYYSQRGAVGGTLLITEATFISAKAGGYDNHPGIWSDEQIEAWRTVTDAVHKNGSYIFMQLWALGRTADEDSLRRDLGASQSERVVVGPSESPMPDSKTIPRELTEEEIWEYINEYGVAAKKAVERAGFDGVEIHGAHGYLPDQFIQDVVNKRTDKWGGTIENRSRFVVEVAKSVAQAVGPNRVGIRLSPYNTWQGMKMSDPKPQYTHLIKELRQLGLAYIHLVESRVSGINDAEGGDSIEWALDAWGKERTALVAGGYKPRSALEAVEGQYKGRNLGIVFGRLFTSNPDLPFRIFNDLPLTPYDRSKFYLPKNPDGYADWHFSPEFTAQNPSFS